jgi:hypothetical protein
MASGRRTDPQEEAIECTHRIAAASVRSSEHRHCAGPSVRLCMAQSRRTRRNDAEIEVVREMTVVKGVGVYASAGAIGLPNDSISSVRIGPNAQAVICKDNDFKGDCILLTSDVRFLTGDRVGNDAVSSAKVQPLGTAECEPGPNQAAFFMHAGSCAVRCQGDRSLC